MVLDLGDVVRLREPYKGHTHDIVVETISTFHKEMFSGKMPDGSNFVAVQFTRDLDKGVNILRRWDEKSQQGLVKLLGEEGRGACWSTWVSVKGF